MSYYAEGSHAHARTRSEMRAGKIPIPSQARPILSVFAASLRTCLEEIDDRILRDLHTPTQAMASTKTDAARRAALFILGHQRTWAPGIEDCARLKLSTRIMS
jgi:hypothetical protein